MHIHRAERADTLVDALAELLADPLGDPFTPEVIAVPAKGIERWLQQRLGTVLGSAAHADGVAANIDFADPAGLVARILAEATGWVPEEDPWAGERVVWTLLPVLDAALTEPWSAVLARHLGNGDAGGHKVGRRYATAARIAELFAGYAMQRPGMITDWAAGTDTDGAGHALPEDLVWQPRLWRQLRAAVGEPSPAERLSDACARLRAEPGVVSLPERISLFGVTRLTTDQLEVLSALSAGRQVHLWLVHPSPALWTKLADAEVIPNSGVRVRHPLLAALGRDVRELQERLSGYDHIDTYHLRPESGGARTLLTELQAAIRQDRWSLLPDPALADSSVMVHSCHGPARQVEVLRDALLGLFVADPTLEPREVIVLCPDVESYAPLVRAAFGQWSLDGAAPGHPAHGLRVRLADRAQRAVNPLLDVIAILLELADGRVTVTEVLDLAAAEPVRLRCGFDEDDIERLRDWAAETGARWGIGQRQRQAFGLGDFAQNTLNAAVDRVLLGVAAGESTEDWLDLVLPLDDVDSNDIDLAGRFAEYVDRLAVCLRDLRGPTLAEPAGSARPASEWAAVLGRALDLLTDVPITQGWQGVQARRELAAATEHAGQIPLRLTDIAALLAARLAGRPSRANFRTGELTVCTMVPMRSVPHRVVVLLGLDDEVFPRTGGVDGDDVLARHRCPGDRDPRSEDRQLLLDAIMAAGERLVLLHTGSDPVTGAHRPPAIPLAELLDTVRAHVGGAAMDQVVKRHPLQPFDRRNFNAEKPFSFDSVALEGALAAQRAPAPRPPFLAAALPGTERGDVELADLVAFAEHPIRAFLWQRLGIRVPESEEEIADRLPIELDGLTKWGMGERMLNARLTGVDPNALRAAEWRRGSLPPFALGAAVLDEVETTVDRLVRVAQPLHEIPSRTVDIAVDLGDGRRLTGTVPDVHDDALLRTTFSRLAPKHRIAAWVRLLALAATGNHQSWRAITIGRGKMSRPAWQSTLTAPNAHAATLLLRDLANLRDEGLAEALPITPAASAAYAERRCQGSSAEDALLAAEHEFDGGKDGPGRYGEHTDRYLRYVLGPAPRFHQLTETRTTTPTVMEAEPTRFGELARRLWNPLLSNENQGQP
ncbi:exodeoxyribonuclease V subunit gamma [Nocardia sp. SYP-A9097]|uniref:exodeoxyribonuclease V subunit gamma n=1 Tax=Nocardia sp. SYP-A9097 TaxID=2663237 RepID=UPI0013238A7D|nr:exodeoxyribonuclease V subunit gamma [Nocardia sp. SYP-A9097]MRH88425.1 exodeoxyribonuclease V subunit gamma [Nocardia sp. SYP-A9097]